MLFQCYLPKKIISAHVTRIGSCITKNVVTTSIIIICLIDGCAIIQQQSVLLNYTFKKVVMTVLTKLKHVTNDDMYLTSIKVNMNIEGAYIN